MIGSQKIHTIQFRENITINTTKKPKPIKKGDKQKVIISAARSIEKVEMCDLEFALDGSKAFNVRYETFQFCDEGKLENWEDEADDRKAA